ncbi:transcriptional regulator [Pseudonocardia sulfidoxydans NBRC 16205]|uniref:Transcriptional regulator n=1 Tax=Pseudonocardia sulfidoxydans NBRC 16205 TaxID=1223511 RepID=A0A511DFU3_9PSEU|nr:DUF5753 domain-containing protein [Pseudonocardia sulfidoxydans]GEL23273.1 transcriptional regulator [Pseudonocardia sulfidoxydans NBRC 16205]
MPVQVESAHRGPRISRLLLGLEFRRLRDERGEQLQETAKLLLISSSKLSRIETGQAVPRPRDLRDLIKHFGIEGTEAAARVRALAESAMEPGWWTELGIAMPSRLETFIEYENAAAEISSHEPIVFPGLLQTADYARAVVTDLTSTDAIDAPPIDDQVALRMARQEHVFDAPTPPVLRTAFPESVLARPVGTTAVMNAQLTLLAERSEDENTHVHVIPNSAGLYRAMEGGFTIFSFAIGQVPDVVNTESVLTNFFYTTEEVVAKHRALFNELGRKWLDRKESRDMIMSYRR